jgi:hypothetical protein
VRALELVRAAQRLANTPPASPHELAASEPDA